MLTMLIMHNNNMYNLHNNMYYPSGFGSGLWFVA